jgi:predicted Rossmann-fold nucleotide-binding protein
MDIDVYPEGSLEILSQVEVNRIRDTSQSGLHGLFRRCALAVLNSGSHIDDSKTLLEAFSDFDVELSQKDRGIQLRLKNAPAGAFVDGELIRGIKEHLFAVLRDIVFVANELQVNYKFAQETSEGITNTVFHVLRNAGIFDVRGQADVVVCWGGHAIGREEYDYTKEIGYELGLRGLDICTGCGVGAMKGPMKGATIAHSKQRIHGGRYIGISEPGIIAAETPNALVNSLVIMPDIEKRLEAFVRVGHAVVVFPGGAGTAEELLYILGIVLHEANRDMPLPLILTGPTHSAPYFDIIETFLDATLGPEARAFYSVVIDDPAGVARAVNQGAAAVRQHRERREEAHYFNWALHIEEDLQIPFVPNHQNMAALEIHRDQPVARLAANLRRAFSGVVAGNVKEQGIERIEAYGPFRIKGDRRLMRQLDTLLRAFVSQQRMRLHGADYQPCYEIVG